MDKELERHLDSLAPMDLRQKEHCLRLQGIKEESEENTRKRIILLLANFL